MVAFEINPSARFYLRRLRRCNGVRERIAIRGECSIDSLDESLTGARRLALICDSEGAEGRLLCPDRIEPLHRA